MRSFVELTIYCIIALLVSTTGMITVGEAMGAMALGLVIGYKNNRGGR